MEWPLESCKRLPLIKETRKRKVGVEGGRGEGAEAGGEAFRESGQQPGKKRIRELQSGKEKAKEAPGEKRLWRRRCGRAFVAPPYYLAQLSFSPFDLQLSHPAISHVVLILDSIDRSQHLVYLVEGAGYNL